jgi:nucleoside 2-deoxyribosyltransferase
MSALRPRVYLAGPDVFRLDASEHMRKLANACELHDLEPLLPSDGLVPVWVPDKEIPRTIYEANMALLRRADGVIANLEPFRGSEPDSGTVFEVGVAVALGLPVVVYGAVEEYAARVQRLAKVTRIDGALRDPKNLVVEDFGLPLNLMLSCSTATAPTALDAIAKLAEVLTAQRN